MKQSLRERLINPPPPSKLFVDAVNRRRAPLGTRDGRLDLGGGLIRHSLTMSCSDGPVRRLLPLSSDAARRRTCSCSLQNEPEKRKWWDLENV